MKKILSLSLLISAMSMPLYGASEVSTSQSTALPSVDSSLATPLPEYVALRDGSDAPASYGNISIEMAQNYDYRPDLQNNPQVTAQDYQQGLFLGYDAPDADDDLGDIASDTANSDDSYGISRDELYDFFDMDWTSSIYYLDDETGFANISQNSEGDLEVNFNDEKLYLNIPYIFSETMKTVTTNDDDFLEGGLCLNEWEEYDYGMPCTTENKIPSARLLLWIDTDLSGTFDADEGMLIDESNFPKYTVDTDKAGSAGYLSSIKTVEVNYDFSGLTASEVANLNENGTYMRLVLTSDTEYGVEDAATNPASTSVGEIEDYHLVSTTGAAKDSLCSFLPSAQSEMFPTEVDDANVDAGELTFKGIDNIYTDDESDTFDLKMTISSDDAEGYKFLTYSDSGQLANANIWYDSLNVTDFMSDSPARFKIEFFDSATGEPVVIPLELVVNDLDRNEWMTFDQTIIDSKNEMDAYYKPIDDNHVAFVLDPDWPSDWFNQSLMVTGDHPQGSVQKVVLSFDPATEISGYYSTASMKEFVVEYFGRQSASLGFTFRFANIDSVEECVSAPEVTIGNAVIEEQLVGSETPLSDEELLDELGFTVTSTGTDSEEVTTSISSSESEIVPLDIDYTAPADYDVYVHVENSDDQTTVVHGILTITDLLPSISVGTPEVTVDVESSELDLISDFDVTATEIEENDVTSDIIASSSVDYMTPGSYPVSYTVTDDEGNEAINSATINVVDDSTEPIVNAPEVTIGNAVIDEQLVGAETPLSDDELLDELGFTVISTGTDSEEVTTSMSSSESEIMPLDIDYTAPADYDIYVHVENSENQITVVHGILTITDLLPSINVATPSITLAVGSDPLDLITDFGVTATEIETSDLTEVIDATSSVDYNTEGTYPVNYTVIDDEGNTATNEAEIVIDSDVPVTPQVTISNAVIDEQLVGSEKPLSNDELLDELKFKVISTGTDSEDVTTSISSSKSEIVPLDIDYTTPADYDVYVHVENSEDETTVVHGILTVTDLLPSINVTTPEITVDAGSSELDLITDFGVTATEIETSDLSSDVIP